MTQNPRIIRGSGGRPKPPPPPYRAPDTLHSRSFATVQDLISEGEIEGFATASKENRTKGTDAYRNASLKDVFLDDTPILAADADSTNPSATDFNFTDVTFQSEFGTSTQGAMSGFPSETRSPVGVNVNAENSDGTESGAIAGSVTRQVSNTGVDAVIVTLTWPQIQKFEEDGDIRGMKVAYKIQIRHDNGTYETKVDTFVSGRTADAYQRDHRISLNSGYTTFDIRVLRMTKDSTSSEQINSFAFTSYQEVIENTSTYPNCAYLALRLDSKQFNRVPERIYRIRGIKVRIPGLGAGSGSVEDRTPTVDLATGRIIYPDNYIFNGTMQQAVYTNCPAMILLDLLTNKRYGLGVHIAPDQSTDAKLYSNIDLFSYVAASKYANELVDDGSNSNTQEARFSCNVNIQSPKEAYEAINELAGVMRCMPIWSAGSITISQDKPTSASYLFNLSNVGQDGFTYQGSSLKQRHSEVSVSYFNMDSKEIDYEVVTDNTALNKLGHTVKQVKAFACTSRNQAARLGRAVLFAEQNESETVTFTTSIDAGIVVRPGSVIEINDPVRAGARRGGRVVSATRNEVTIDSVSKTLLPNPNDNPVINVILPDGTVEVGRISNMLGSVISVDLVTKLDGTQVSQFSSAPLPNSPYLISSNALKTQLFRVIQIEEQDDVNYAITALSYVEGKYNFIENGDPLPARTVSLLNAPAPTPINLSVTEKTVVLNSIARSKLIIDWSPVQGVTQYLVTYKFEDNNPISQIVFNSDFEILDSDKGVYEIEVSSYNILLELSPNKATAVFNAIGKTALPEDVQNLTIEPINEQFVRLRFTQAKAIDVLHGGRVYVRHTQVTGANTSFQAAQDVIEAVAGNSTEVIAPAISGTYLLKFQDDGGRFSANAAKVETSLVNIVDSITVKNDREDTDNPKFNGVRNFVTYDSTQGGLKLTSPSTQPIGFYYFEDPLDLQSIFSINLLRHFQGTGFYEGANFDSRTENIDDWVSFDGTEAPNANAQLQVATTDLNPSTTTAAQYQLVGSPVQNKVRIGQTGHGLVVGDVIFVTFTAGAALGFQGMNREYTVAEVESTDLVNANSDTDFNMISTTSTCTISKKFKQFNDVASGMVRARGFRFRIKLSTTDSAQNMLLQQGGYKAFMQTRTEQSVVINSGLGAKSVTFTTPFFVGTTSITNIPKPSVSISPQSVTGKIMAAGDYFELSNITGTGFTVHFKNSSGGNIDRDFTYNAVGFGKGG